MEKFINKYREEIQGTLSGFDRLVFRGTLRRLNYGRWDKGLQSMVVQGMEQYLWHNQILFNQSTNPTVATNGGGLIVMGASPDGVMANGVECGGTVGAGASANVLVGGPDRRVIMQPVSVQAQTGVNIAAGVSTMELRPATAPARRVVR